MQGMSVVGTGRHSTKDVIACDLLESEEVKSVIQKINPEKIIHCAAYTPKQNRDYQDIDGANMNLVMVENILASTSCPIIYTSSMTVYGSVGQGAKHEDEAGDPVSEYGIGKWKAEKLMDEAGCRGFAVRIPGLFGFPRNGGLIGNLVKYLKGEGGLILPDKPVLWAGMHVDDAADSIVKLTLAEVKGFYPINIAYPGQYSISKLLTIITEISGHTFEYTVEHPIFEFDLTRARKFNAGPSCTLKDAIMRVMNE